jgi:hypothetical protein
MALGSYAPARWALVLILATIAAFLASLLGGKPAAWGVVAGAPVGWLNYLVTCVGLQNAAATKAAAGVWPLLAAVMFRKVTGIVALLLAATQGAEFLLGVLAGLLFELVAHCVDPLRLRASRPRGD